MTTHDKAQADQKAADKAAAEALAHETQGPHVGKAGHTTPLMPADIGAADPDRQPANKPGLDKAQAVHVGHPSLPSHGQAQSGGMRASVPPVSPTSPDPEDIMKHFTVDGVAEPLRNVAKMYNDTAAMVFALHVGPDTTIALRKLLESRDSALRAATK